MSDRPVDPEPWGACRFCGVAVPPGVRRCGICGAEEPVPAAALPNAPSRVRRRLLITGSLRTMIVVGVAVGLAYTMIAAVLSGPPSVADPLTTSGTYSIAPGHYALLSGEVSGGDFVIGNYSTVRPTGTSLEVSVYNSSEWTRFLAGTLAAPAYSVPAQPEGRIIFSASYTDTFYFVFENPYPASSPWNITAYIATQYESNVGDDGFA